MRSVNFCWILLFLQLIYFTAEAQRQQNFRRRNPGRRRPTQPPEEAESSGCPAYDGFFADSTQCDKYYECIDGEMKTKLCPDGLVFDATRSDIEKCELFHLVDCSDRPLQQPPQPSPKCPRKNGYYAHSDPRICDTFFQCSDGRPHAIICPAGLIFSNITATCSFPGENKPSTCVFGAVEKPKTPEVTNTALEEDNQDLVFRCPKVETRNANHVAHPLYPDPKDCQFYYICIGGTTPQRNGCELGKVFNDATKVCASPKDVPECKDWYADVLDYDEAGEIATTTTTTPKPRTKRPPGSGPKRRGKPPVTAGA